MKTFAKLFTIMGTILLAGMLSACASSDKGSSDPGAVQDIQPGQSSIIQPPSATPENQASTLEERNL